MQIDDVVWHIINQGHCNFKIKTIEHAFCLYDFNVTGLCNRESCPLANSNYATCKEERGKIFLYIKNVERAHNPNMLWQKVELDKNYNKSLE